MKPIAIALLLLAATAAFAAENKQDLSVNINSNDTHTHIAPRHEARDARLVITTRHGAAVLMLLKDSVAVQLADSTMAQVKSKDDAGFFEDLLVSGVRFAIGKSVEYPIAYIRSAELRNGVLVLTNDEGKPVFDQIKINGENLTHDIAPADAARFVNAFRALKASR